MFTKRKSSEFINIGTIRLVSERRRGVSCRGSWQTIFFKASKVTENNRARRGQCLSITRALSALEIQEALSCRFPDSLPAAQDVTPIWGQGEALYNFLDGIYTSFPENGERTIFHCLETEETTSQGRDPPGLSCHLTELSTKPRPTESQRSH